MKGIRLLQRTLASFDKLEKRLDLAVKQIQQHKADNDKTLAREHGKVHCWLALAEDVYKRAVAYANAHRDQAARTHLATDTVLTVHEQRAKRVRDRFKELLA